MSYTVIVSAPGSYEVAVKSYVTNGDEKIYSAESNTVTYELAATKLAAPVITKSSDTVTWEAITNASGYRVYVNAVSLEEVQTTSWRFSETDAGDYTVTVRAVSDTALYTASDDSNSVTFTVGQRVEGEIRVTDAPYNAAGDGITNDRAAIQQAIDDICSSGGGKVVLSGGRQFLTSNLILRDNVELHFENGAKLLQSDDEDAYVKYEDGAYVKFEPAFGMDLPGDVEWNHAWTYNYPLVLAPEGTRNIKITGSGVITMASHELCYDTMHIAPIGLFNVDGFEISDITIDGYQSYGMMVTSSFNGLIKKVTIRNPRCSCNDGINMQNNQNIRVTECDVRSGDDALYVGAYYDDPRGSGITWWNNNRTHIANKNLEFDNNHAEAGPNCKGFSFHFGGYMLDDVSEGEISDIYVHDNYFNTFGVWNHSPDPHAQYKPNMTLKPYQPFKSVRWENNEVDVNMGMGIPCSDMYDDTGTFKSMKQMLNGDFDYAKLGYWVVKDNGTDGSAGMKTSANNNYGYIDKLDKGDAKLYQGLWLEAEKSYEFSANVRATGGAKCRIFVRDLLTQTLIASKEFDNADRQVVRLEFSVPAAANYHIGIERGNAVSGGAEIDDATVISSDSRHTVFVAQTPATAANDGAYDLGTAFTVSTSGYVESVRAYICENETGTHSVRIWNKTTGDLIAGPFDWIVERGNARWETFALPNAVRVKSGTEYIVSVSTGDGNVYPVTENGFNGVAAHSRYITVNENSGVRTVAIGEMPTSDANGSNFFRDIVFVPDEQSIFDFDTAAPEMGDNANGEYGVVFSADVDGYVTKVRFYAREGLSGTSAVRIWKADGEELVAGPYEWTLTGGAAGWKEFTLPSPLSVSANVKYVASVSQTSGWFASTPGVFNADKTIRNLHTYTGSGVSGELGQMPTNVWSNQSFFRDIVFTPSSYADSLTENYLTELKTLYGTGEIDDGNYEQLGNLCTLITDMFDELSPDALAAISQADKDLVTEVAAAVAEYDEYCSVHQTLLGYTVPDDIDGLNGDYFAGELGVIFSADVDGFVTKVKVLVRAGCIGASKVSVWEQESATLIATYDWTLTGGAAGWKQFTLPAPLSVEANKKYVVSITQPVGTWYCNLADVFTAEAQKRNLHTYVGSGVSGELGQMPANVWNNQSFFRDIVFTPDEAIGEVAAEYMAEFKALYGTGGVTENNVTELRGLVSALQGFIEVCDDDIFTDSDRQFIADVIDAIAAYDYAANVDQSVFGYTVPDMGGLNGDYFTGELGLIFSADVDGFVTKVKFLAREGCSGSSKVSVWEQGSATLIATYDWTVTGSAAGWKEFTLPSPLSVRANIKYVVSITQPAGTWYCNSFEVFGAPIRSGNLHTYVGSGVTSSAIGEMPTNVYGNQSFYRDVVFTPTSFIGMLTQSDIEELKTLYGDGQITESNVAELGNLSSSITELIGALPDDGSISQADKDFVAAVVQAVADYYDNIGGGDNDDDYTADASVDQSVFDNVSAETAAGSDANLEYGIVFSADVAGYVTKVKFWAREGLAGAVTVRVWNFESGALLAGPYDWTVTGGAAGWKEFTLPAPVSIEANVKYVASVGQTIGWVSSTPGVFAAPVDNGNLHTFNGSGVYGDIGSMPSNSWENQTYYRDIVFTPASSLVNLVKKYIAELKTLYGDGHITENNVGELRNLSSSITELMESLPDGGSISQADKDFVASVFQAVSE